MDSGAKINSPMKVMMGRRLEGGEMDIGRSSITYKPASVKDYLSRKGFRDRGGFPGYSIAKRSCVRLITFSEFNYPDQKTRLAWKSFYAHVIRKYNMGLEYRVNLDNDDDEDLAKSITVERLELLKQDLQKSIWARKSPGERRVRRGKNVEDHKNVEDRSADIAEFEDTDAPETIDWESEGFTESVIEIPQYAS